MKYLNLVCGFGLDFVLTFCAGCAVLQHGAVEKAQSDLQLIA